MSRQAYLLPVPPVSCLSAFCLRSAAHGSYIQFPPLITGPPDFHHITAAGSRKTGALAYHPLQFRTPHSPCPNSAFRIPHSALRTPHFPHSPFPNSAFRTPHSALPPLLSPIPHSALRTSSTPHSPIPHSAFRTSSP